MQLVKKNYDMSPRGDQIFLGQFLRKWDSSVESGLLASIDGSWKLQNSGRASIHNASGKEMENICWAVGRG